MIVKALLILPLLDQNKLTGILPVRIKSIGNIALLLPGPVDQLKDQGIILFDLISSYIISRRRSDHIAPFPSLKNHACANWLL